MKMLEPFRMAFMVAFASMFGWAFYAISGIGKGEMNWKTLLYSIPPVAVIGFVVGSVLNYYWKEVPTDIACAIGSVFGAGGDYWMKRFINITKKVIDQVEEKLPDNNNNTQQ